MSNTVKCLKDKQKTLKDHVQDLDVKIEKRPTLLTIVTLLLGAVGVIITLSTFITGRLLTAQSDTFKAETKVCVLEAMDQHKEAEQRSWVQRRDDLIDDVLAYLKNNK